MIPDKVKDELISSGLLVILIIRIICWVLGLLEAICSYSLHFL